MAERVILHCDCNNFFASSEILRNPALAHIPMAVAGDPENRHGIILSKNELAKKYGIKTAETVFAAKEKCRDLVLVPPHYDQYLQISKKINALYLEYTDLVDPFGIDESFLDLTGSMRLLSCSPLEAADTIRNRIRREIGVTVSVGVSFCRVFAKLGSDYKKPDATTVIDRDNYRTVAFPLPVSALLFVGSRTESALRRLGILTIGDLAAADRLALVKLLGEAGDTLWRYANGLDTEPVRSYYDRPKPKSIGNGMTFRRNIVGEEEIRVGVMALCDSVAARLRQENRKCRVIQVQIKNPDFTTIQRQTTLEKATWLRSELISAAVSIISSCHGFGTAVRALTVTAAELVAPGQTEEQLDIFSQDAPEEKQEQVEGALQEIRRRFGDDSIHLGCYDNGDIGVGTVRRKS